MLTESSEQRSRRVLVLSDDVVGKHMAGSALRYVQLARTLAQHFAVSLAIPQDSTADFALPELQVVRYTREDWQSLQPHASAAEVVILPSDSAHEFPQLAQCDAALVVDGYDPQLAEWLQLTAQLDSDEQQQRWRERMQTMARQYLIGDFYLCTSERQRDWFLGLLEAHGRINPLTYRTDPSLRQLVDVVPHGLHTPAAKPSRPIVKGVWTGIGTSDRVLVWGGGLWTWLDPLTAIRAVAKVAPQRPDVRLIFPATKRPNALLANIPTHNESARALARDLGLLNTVVYFGDWTPYEDWLSLLCECDIALSLGRETYESRLAFRSRIPDYIAAALPIIATRGDASSDLIAQYGLGELVAVEDVDGVASAMLQLLARPRSDFVEAFAASARALNWERVAEPLIAFCRAPRRACDRAAGMVGNPFYLQQIAELQARLDAANAGRRAEDERWNALEASLGWGVLRGLQRLRSLVTPQDSRRERWLLASLSGLRRLRRRVRPAATPSAQSASAASRLEPSPRPSGRAQP